MLARARQNRGTPDPNLGSWRIIQNSRQLCNGCLSRRTENDQGMYGTLSPYLRPKVIQSPRPIDESDYRIYRAIQLCFPWRRLVAHPLQKKWQRVSSNAAHSFAGRFAEIRANP